MKLPKPPKPPSGSPASSALPTQIAGQPAVAAPVPPAPGADNYQLGREIARGGMGSILEAGDAKLKRTVALKAMLFDAEADAPARQRFVREAEVLAQLAHPNIVPIHDLVWEDGLPLFYTMKLVKGRTLQTIIHELQKRNREYLREFTLDRLLFIFRKICDAVAFAHSKGILHRDLKPENVMVGEFGEVLVMDWGLAKQIGVVSTSLAGEVGVDEAAPSTPRVDATLQGSIMGTPQYMSPEQALGQIDELDERSDIFSLGGILYAILTLHPPIEGQSLAELLDKAAKGQIIPLHGGMQPAGASSNHHAAGDDPSARGEKRAPRSPSATHLPGGHVPAALASVVRKALQLDKAQRYQSVVALSADIEAFQSGFATMAEQAGLGKQLVLLVKRHQGTSSTVAVAWVLITALAIWFVSNLRVKERRAVAGEQRAVAGELRAVAGERAAKTSEALAREEKESARKALAKTALALAEAARREGNGPEMQAALGAVPDDLRDSTWNYLLDQSDTSIARIRSGAFKVEGVAAHPRQPGVFAITDDKTRGIVRLIEVRSGAQLLEFACEFPSNIPGFHVCLAFSPGGERIALAQAGDAGGVAIHSARDGRRLLAWEAPPAHRLEFSADGQLLLQTDGDNQHLRAWDSATGQLRWTYESGRKDVRGAFTPDSQYVLTNSFSDQLRLVSAQDGALVRPILAENARAMAIRPDGKMAVISTPTVGKIKGVRLQDGVVLFEIHAHDSPITNLAFTPDGARFVSVAVLADGRQALQVWDAEKGLPLQTLLGGSGYTVDASVHPLSGELLVTGPNARAWNLTGTPEKWTLRHARPSLAFWGSDDVVFAPATGMSAVLQELQAGSPTVLWRPPSPNYRRPSVSADGRFAAMGQLVVGNDNTVLVLRNPGSQMAQVATFKLSALLTLLRLSPTGERLAAIQNNHAGVALYDPATGGQPVTLEHTDLKLTWDIGWLGDQRLVGLATAKAARGNPGSEEWIVLWDAVTSRILQTATNRTAMDVLAVAPDGRSFAEAGVDKLVRIRDAATLAVRQEFRAHDGPITALAWHPTKPVLATASADLSVKLWDLATGRRLEELRGPLAAPYTLAFSPSGRRLGCAGTDGFTRIWEPQSLNDQLAPEKAGGWDDVLASLTPGALMQAGHGWRLENGAIFSPRTVDATLPLPVNLGGTSYQVRLRLRQLAAQNMFHLALPVAGRMTGFELDGGLKDGFYTGLILVDDQWGRTLPGTVHGKQIKDSEQHELEVTVRLNDPNATITATLDEQPLYEWTGPTASLSQQEKWITPPGNLALGTHASDWVVYEVKVKRLDQ